MLNDSEIVKKVLKFIPIDKTSVLFIISMW